MRARAIITTCLLALLLLPTACRRQSRPVEQGRSATNLAQSPADSARVLMERVDHYYKNVQHDSLYALAPQAMAYNREHGQWTNYYTTWCLLANDLVWNGEMDKGLAEAQRMHEDAISRNNAFGLSEAYTAMGIAYHFQGNNKESAASYRQALQHYPKDADQSVKQNIYSYYCQVLIDLQDYDATADVLSQWDHFLHQQTGGDTASTRYAHWYFRYHRECYKYRFALSQYGKASSELDAMQHFLEKEDDRQLYEAQVAGFRTQLAMARQDYTQAMAYNDQEIELSKRQDFNTFLNALKHRSDMLQQLGRYEEALKAWRSYDQQKDSLVKADTRQQLNELNKRFEVDELKAQQVRTQLEHERSQLELVILLGAIVVIALVLLLLFRHRANKRLREAHALLERSNHELQESYEQLKIANARANESSAMKTNFIHQISHEIRTPLNILYGFTQVLTAPDMELEDDERDDIANRITESTNRITGLVNKMLELSEASSQTVIERSSDVPAQQIALQATDDSGITRASHIDFALQAPPETEVTIHATNLRYAARALTILLDNAQKFTKEGHVTLSVAVSESMVSYTVEDTGIGIPIEEAEHIFDEFVQLDEYYDGTGIGLPIARSIARRLGGDIMLDTSYTGGARFVMLLPLADTEKT